jgi:hypothetical protein
MTLRPREACFSFRDVESTAAGTLVPLSRVATRP